MGLGLRTAAPGRGICSSSCGQRASCGSDSRLFLFPQFCLSPDAGRGANAGLWCPPSPLPPRSLPRGDSGGTLAVTPCAWSDPRPFPSARFFLSPAGNPTSHCPPPKRLGEAQVGQGSDPGRKGPLLPAGERCEHPGSLAPAAVMGTPYPIYFSTSFLPSFLPLPLPLSGFFLCQLCRFYFIPVFPFHREIKV